MKLPLGLDAKSIVVGILLAMFVIPWVRGMVSNLTAPKSVTEA